MDIGFTGTREGMTKPQLIRVATSFSRGPGMAHHGDCVGADDEFAEIAYRMSYEVHGHPPLNESKRAFSPFTHIGHPPKDYHPRNHDIVDATTLTVGAPKDYSPEAQSGTWATIRYAIERKKIVYVYLPDGSMLVSFLGAPLSWEGVKA
jgi:hypothetical protein